MKQEIIFLSSGNKLVGTLYVAKQGAPGVLFVSGGGLDPHNAYWVWQAALAKEGFNSLTFDFPGVGDSQGRIEDNSLQSRLEDSRVALRELEKVSSKIALAGRSMGGPVAIRLASEIYPYAMILTAPAAYSASAWDKKFTTEFPAVIRREGSWQDSPSFNELENYAGKLLVVYGEQDEVIPAPIHTRYRDIATRIGRFVDLPCVGHRYLRQKDSIGRAAQRALFNANIELLK